MTAVYVQGWWLDVEIDYAFSHSPDSFFCYLINLAKTAFKKKKKGFCLELIILSLLLPDLTDLTSTYELVADR